MAQCRRVAKLGRGFQAVEVQPCHFTNEPKAQKGAHLTAPPRPEGLPGKTRTSRRPASTLGTALPAGAPGGPVPTSCPALRGCVQGAGQLCWHSVEPWVLVPGAAAGSHQHHLRGRFASCTSRDAPSRGSPGAAANLGGRWRGAAYSRLHFA